MQVDNPKAAELYSNLIREGYTSKNLGDVNDFSKALTDPTKASKIYSALIEDGYTEDNLGTQKEFMQTFTQNEPKYKITQQALSDFSATISAKPNLTPDEIFKKFPEFNNDPKLLQSALDYAATAQSGKYKTVDELNSKFPEFDFTPDQSVRPIENPLGSNGFSGKINLSTDPQKTEFEGINPIDLAKQSDQLSQERTETPQDPNNPNVGGNYVPNTKSVEKSKKINDYLTKNGYDAGKLNKLFSDFPDEYYTALGVTKDQMAQNLKDNPVKTEQQIASAKWQIPVQQNILNTQGQQGLVDFQNMRNVFADKGTDYATKRKLAPQLLQTIRLNTPAGEMSKVQANFANDAAQAYGDVQDTDPTLIAEQKQYPNLDLNQVRALDYLKGVSPDKAQGFAAALVDPSKIKDNYDAQVGQQEKLKRLEEIGISLKENSLNEQFAPIKQVYDQLYNLKQNGTITPEQDAQLQQAEAVGAPLYDQLQSLEHQKNDLLVKYPAAGVNDAGLFAQELLGQKHTGLNWLALETGQATSGAANSVWDLVSEPFRSDENSKIHQLSTLGDMKNSQTETNLTQDNQVSKSFTPTLSPDLQQYVDQLKSDKTLTDKQKSDALTKKLMENPDQWQRTPIEGGKTNIGITSMLYGIQGN